MKRPAVNTLKRKVRYQLSCDIFKKKSLFLLAEADLLSLSSKVKDLWNTGLGRISMIRGKVKEKPDNFKNDKIVFVMAIAGRFTTFQRFLNNYEEVSYKL